MDFEQSAFEIAISRLEEMVNDLPVGKVIQGEIHRCDNFQSVIDLISRNRADLTMFLSKKFNNDINILNQIREHLGEGETITIGVFSYKDKK